MIFSAPLINIHSVLTRCSTSIGIEFAHVPHAIFCLFVLVDIHECRRETWRSECPVAHASLSICRNPQGSSGRILSAVSSLDGKIQLNGPDFILQIRRCRDATVARQAARQATLGASVAVDTYPQPLIISSPSGPQDSDFQTISMPCCEMPLSLGPFRLWQQSGSRDCP